MREYLRVLTASRLLSDNTRGSELHRYQLPWMCRLKPWSAGLKYCGPVAKSNFGVARKQADIGQPVQRRNYKTIEESDGKQNIISCQSGAFVQKLHGDAREKFTGNKELFKIRCARMSHFTVF